MQDQQLNRRDTERREAKNKFQSNISQNLQSIYNYMIINSITDFVVKTPSEELRKLREVLDLLKQGHQPNVASHQVDLLIWLRDHEKQFQRLADQKIRVSDLDAEKQDRIRRNVPPARWGK